MKRIVPEAWQLIQGERVEEKSGWIEAEVPGCIHYDLMRAGKLSNPYASTENAVKAAWVAESEWTYQSEVYLEEADIREKQIVLRVYGIDTYSDIYVNGHKVGSTANAYRIYEFPVDREWLTPGANRLTVYMKSFSRMIAPVRERAECLKRDGRTEGMLGKALIRRYQRSFFTTSSLLNLGTGVLGMGINRPLFFCCYDDAFIRDYHFSTEDLYDDTANIAVEAEFNRPVTGTVKMSMEDETGKRVLMCETELVQAAEVKIEAVLEKPDLWWPAGYGKPTRYQLKLLLETDDGIRDLKTCKVGIRKVRLVTELESGRKTFYFEVNGTKVYIHGQNYIPLDYLKVYGTSAEYESLFRLIENGNINLIRLWGGGAVEEQEFYEACDRLGIMVWQELFLHSNVYPDYDEAFLSDFLKETECVIKQVRNHPCFCLLCGGNEQQEGWDEWGWKQELDRFYGESLPLIHVPPLAVTLCPEIPYIYNSPHGGKWAQSPVEGECHNWGNFYNATKDPLFVTETCWTTESYSRPETLEKYMGIKMEDFTGVGWGERWKELTSLPIFNRMPYSNWFDYRSLAAYLFSLELEQARADYHAISQFRFHSPSNSGVIYWSLNKGGPLFQFGCVDYGGWPLMSYYVMKRLYSPMAVSLYRDLDDVRAVISNHSGGRRVADLIIRHLSGDGACIEEKNISQISMEAGETSCRAVINDLYKRVCSRTKESVHAVLKEGDAVVFEDLLLFCPYSEYTPQPGHVFCDVIDRSEGHMTLRFRTDGIIPMICIEGSRTVCSDNYFFLTAGYDRVIRLEWLDRAGSRTIVVRNLYGDELWRQD